MCSTIASSELTQEKTYLFKNAARFPLPEKAVQVFGQCPRA